MRFQFEQVLEVPRSELFAFHEDPEHLGVLHRGWSAFRMIEHDGPLHHGSRIWFETTVAYILPVVLGFENDVYEPPHRFGEHLIHGPFSKFSHLHEFEEAAGSKLNGGTLLRDTLEVELPWFYGGELAMKLLVAPWLRRAFAQRAATLGELVRLGEVSRGRENRSA